MNSQGGMSKYWLEEKSDEATKKETKGEAFRAECQQILAQWCVAQVDLTAWLRRQPLCRKLQASSYGKVESSMSEDSRPSPQEWKTELDRRDQVRQELFKRFSTLAAHSVMAESALFPTFQVLDGFLRRHWPVRVVAIPIEQLPATIDSALVSAH